MVKLLNKEVGNIGYGLMGLTWRQSPPSQDTAFKAMKTSIANGSIFWNGGEFYGPPTRNSLHLLNEYFTKYPEDADKIILSIKGGSDVTTLVPDGSKAGIQRSIDNVLKLLGGKKSLDLFECARVDPNTPIEETIGYIAEYVKAGKVGGICLSEVNGDSIRRAAKVHPIAGVEVEFSLLAPDILKNGVAKACAENNIPIIAYSPVGRGLLTGKWKSNADIPADMHVKHHPQFVPEVFNHNMRLVNAVDDLAKKKGVTVGQVAIAWVAAQSRRNGNPEIIPIPGATTDERVVENSKQVQLTEDEMVSLDNVLKTFEVKGTRYPAEILKWSQT